ncbi:MAG: bifunctional metallophosphatase/5'-nucleotidase [Symploca sp. SIO2E9]|nr:bifunctional metallophosphatase/5'-nucleotidase [Symploca sp. SIO2E9]
MKQLKKLFSLGLLLLAISIASPAWAEMVDITLLQFNDVYEIEPVSGGESGGLARVATLRRQLKKQNPRTYTILSGDCFSPSALGTAEVNGEPLAGEQMVAVLNTMGLDFATFGNHEFDLKENQFLERLKESRFTWFSSNVYDADEQPFPGVPKSQIINVRGNEGTLVRVGLIGLTLDSNPVDYVIYHDPIEEARQQVQALKDKVDILVAVTHLALPQDQELAETVPEIDLILGGHEHENIQQWRGGDFTPLFKADANVRTVYIHDLQYDTNTGQLEVESHLQLVTDKIPSDPRTTRVVYKWVKRGNRAFEEKGFEPGQVVGITPVPLDGLEASVRNYPTTLTKLIAEAMLQDVDAADLSVYNSGSIRIDDVIPPGPITQYDVIRILPFGGNTLYVKMKGSLVKQVLDQGIANQGSGGYLLTGNVSLNSENNSWMINGQALDPNLSYPVAINDFLLTGKEIGLDFLTFDNPDVELIAEKGDIRFAVIDLIREESSQG